MPVVFDISGIQDDQAQLRAAALMASWSAGFGTVNVAQSLAAAGLEPQRHYIIAMDEIHQALRSESGMVERYDQLTRLNRRGSHPARPGQLPDQGRLPPSHANRCWA